ncbi:MAG: hypothetical protein K0B00_00530 [Rhodobacteraceae bacterium]|nr:hypothetical protein [Paracoccaceae bacterium]
MPVYLDQNVLSRLQPKSLGRDSLLDSLREMAKSGAVYVYSFVHVAESRASGRAEVFAAILDEIDACFLEPKSMNDAEVTLSRCRAREMLLAEHGFLDDAVRGMEVMLKLIQFALGWLGELEERVLLDELQAEINSVWASLGRELPESWRAKLEPAWHEMSDTIQGLPLHQLRAEGRAEQRSLRGLLPNNYAQLDEKPSETAASFIFARLDENERRKIQEVFPLGFWSEIEKREDGLLAGFSFMLFIHGLVRDRRTRAKGRDRREKHFLGQFRDCQHIEAATCCRAFVTFDSGAARLAKAAYAYAGATTEVIHLTSQNP